MSCECKIVNVTDSPGQGQMIVFCPLHDSATDLLKACKAARISLLDDRFYEEFKPVIKTLEVAITKAKPPKLAKPGWFA